MLSGGYAQFFLTHINIGDKSRDSIRATPYFVYTESKAGIISAAENIVPLTIPNCNPNDNENRSQDQKRRRTIL